ncbi:hypothetical protein Tco_0415446 [Tanacetum coccineum]
MRLSIRRGDNVERAITTDSSLVAAQDSDNISKTQTTAMLNVDIPQGMDTGGSPRCQETMGVLLLRQGGYTPGSDEGRLKLEELMTMCTKLSKQVLTWRKRRWLSCIGDPQTKEKSQKIRKIEEVKHLTPKKEDIQAVDFDDFNVLWMKRWILYLEKIIEPRKIGLMIQSGDTKGVLILLLAKQKGVAITKVEDSSRIVRPVRLITTLKPLPTIDPKDKGKGVLVEEESNPSIKIKRSDQGDLQARMDVDYELAARMTQEEQEKYTIEERARLLAEFFERRKKQLAAEREEAIRNKPPTKTQLRNLMMTYLKNMGDYKHSQLKGKTYEEIHELYERQQKRIQYFIPMDSEKEVIKDSGKKDDSSSKPAGGSRRKTLARKRTGEKQSKESTKRQKLEDAAEEQESAESNEEAAANYEQEKEELRMWLTVVPDEEETVDPEILSAKADGNASYRKSLSSMLRKFDRQDLVMFEPNAKDAIWSNQHDWTLISWKLYENCGVHTLLMDGTLTCFNMLVEKRYPLIKEMLEKVLNWKLEAEAESTMAFKLLKFIKSQLEE